jgi:hypothetical protein
VALFDHRRAPTGAAVEPHWLAAGERWDLVAGARR